MPATRARGLYVARNPTAPGAVKRLAGRLHFHPCTTCSMRYSCSCKTPKVNAQCITHRPGGGHHRAPWDIARDPVACCYRNVEQILDNNQIERYQLAGPGPWFQCTTCFRAHAHPPKETA